MYCREYLNLNMFGISNANIIDTWIFRNSEAFSSSDNARSEYSMDGLFGVIWNHLVLVVAALSYSFWGTTISLETTRYVVRHGRARYILHNWRIMLTLQSLKRVLVPTMTIYTYRCSSFVYGSRYKTCARTFVTYKGPVYIYAILYICDSCCDIIYDMIQIPLAN